jgi:hypothetical protein
LRSRGVRILFATALVLAHPLQLQPLPASAVTKCRQMQSHVPFAVLCPARLPRAVRGWKVGDPPAPFRSEILGSPGRPQLRTPYGLEFGYSAPVEPGFGPNWRSWLWHNGPCCFLHFTIFRPAGAALPHGLKRTRLGGRQGWLLAAKGYGLPGTVAYWWANHTWFFWRQNGTTYTASLHYLGRGTTPLLSRLIRELRPAGRLSTRR